MQQEFFQLSAVKSYFLAHDYRSEHLKEYVKDIYFTNLFSMYDFDSVYDDRGQLLITKKLFDLISIPITPLIKQYREDANLYPAKLSNKAKSLDKWLFNDRYILSKYTKNFAVNNDKKGKQRILDKAKHYRKHIENLKTLRTANLIVSIDFEYNGLNRESVSEAGLTLFYPKENKFVYRYFILKDSTPMTIRKANLRNSFNFGITEFKTTEDMFLEIDHYIDEADMLLAHDIINELQILNIKPNWNKVIDTKFCELVLNPKSFYLSLKDALIRYDISHSSLHNAGNDAAYSLHLALKMLNEVENENIAA